MNIKRVVPQGGWLYRGMVSLLALVQITAFFSGSFKVARAAAPVISNVQAVNISYSSVTIEWDTDIAATQNRILYSTTATSAPFDYATVLRGPSSGTTVMGLTFGGLAPSTTYNFQACSTASGVEGCSATQQFTTLAAPGNRFSTPTQPTAVVVPAMPVINGNTYTVASDCSDLQSKLNTVAGVAGSANHQVLIPVGASCTGNYNLPSRTGTGWIILRSAASDSQLPAEGVRATSTDAQYMPTLSPADAGRSIGDTVFYSGSGTSKWRLVGLNLTAPSGGHMALFNPQRYSSDIIVDRCVLTNNSDTTYGLMMQGTRMAVVNSWLNIVRPSSTAVAISMSMAQGLLIDNNYINAPGISVFAEEESGTEPSPVDITITRNLFEWSDSYRTTTVTRQHLEFKTGRRILIDGNIFRDEWVGGITGNFSNAIIFTPRFGWSGTIHGTVNGISDVTITNNVLYHIPGGINIYGNETSNRLADVPSSRRFLIKNNLMFNIDGFYASPGHSANGVPLFLGGALEDIVIDHNTFFDPRGNVPYFMFWMDGRGSGLKVKNNVIGYNKYTNNFGGISFGSDVPFPTPTIPTTNPGVMLPQLIQASPNPDPTMEFTGNLIVPGVTDTTSSASYDSTAVAVSKASCDAYWGTIAGNTCAGNGSTDTANKVFASLGLVGPYTTYSGFQFASNSIYKNSAPDSTDYGPNMTTLAAVFTAAQSGGGDVIAPVVSLTAPSAGATVLGTSTAISATASDNSIVAGVKFYVGNTLIGSEDTVAPYAVTWDTTLVTNGSYNLVAVARDAAGNVATSSPISITVGNDTTPPVLSAISAGSLTTTGATVSWTTNESSDTQLEYGLTSGYGSTTSLVASLVTSHTVNLSGLASGTLYHFRVKSRDATGNLAVSSDQTFTTASAAVVTSPSSGGGGGGSSAVTIQRKLKLDLQGTTNKIVSGTLSYLNPTTKTVLSSQSFTTDSNGECIITLPSGLPTGTILRVSVQGYLPKVYSGLDLTTTTIQTILIPQLPAGDFNGDGVVNSIDYSQLNLKWNTTSLLGIYDINRDGKVDDQDLTIIKSNWNMLGE